MLDEHSDGIGVLITDQRMPGAYGVVLLNYVKENYPHIVRLLTTAYSDLDDAIDAVNSGEILRYIVKPWDIKALHTELRHALRFFYMQSERDQLIGEKLSVWQRMTEINRVRDLLVMAGSFSHLNHSVQGIRSLLLQAPVTVELFSDEHSLEMWGLLEDEVKHMLTLAASIKAATRSADGQFSQMSVSDLLQPMADAEVENGKLQITLSSDLPQPKVCPDLLSRLFEALMKYVTMVADNPDLDFAISGSKKGNVLVLSIKPVITGQLEPIFFSVNKELLIAFLIAAHHGGDVVLNKGAAFGIDLLLPLEGDEIFNVGDEGYWLDEIFSLYET